MFLNHFVCKSSFKLRKQRVAATVTLKRWCAVELRTAKQRTGERIPKPVSLRQSVTTFFCLLYAFMLWPEQKTPESLILFFESDKYFLDKLHWVAFAQFVIMMSLSLCLSTSLWKGHSWKGPILQKWSEFSGSKYLIFDSSLSSVLAIFPDSYLFISF